MSHLDHIMLYNPQRTSIAPPASSLNKASAYRVALAIRNLITRQDTLWQWRIVPIKAGAANALHVCAALEAWTEARRGNVRM